MQAEVRTIVNPVVRGSPAGRVRSHVTQPLADRLGPLTTDPNAVQPTPSSENILVTRGGPPQVAHQATTSSASTASQSTSGEWACDKRWSTTGASPSD